MSIDRRGLDRLGRGLGRMTRAVVVAALAVMLAATACGGNGNDASGVKGTADVIVTAHDYSFDPEQITVEKGAAVALDTGTPGKWHGGKPHRQELIVVAATSSVPPAARPIISRATTQPPKPTM
jgi:hypothetical protein